MSDLDDPRVLFAAERTLLAWNRTVAGLMALGFFIDRATLVSAPGTDRRLAACIGIAFVLLGVVLNVISVVHYRRAIATLRPVEIPPRYWPNLASGVSLGVALLGLLLSYYLIASL